MRLGRVAVLLVALGSALYLGLRRTPSDAPPGALTALINASAPRDDLFASRFCGGVLVAADKVATARHCIRDRRPERIDVLVGARNLCNTDTIQGQRLAVRDITTYPQADLSILHLASSSTIEPLSISGSSEASPLLAYGWGTESPGGVGRCTPKLVRLHDVDDRLCIDAAPRDPSRLFDPEVERCLRPAKGEEHNTCTGDSGGPVLRRTGRRFELVAIISWGWDCKPGAVGAYADARLLLK